MNNDISLYLPIDSNKLPCFASIFHKKTGNNLTKVSIRHCFFITKVTNIIERAEKNNLSKGQMKEETSRNFHLRLSNSLKMQIARQVCCCTEENEFCV